MAAEAAADGSSAIRPWHRPLVKFLRGRQKKRGRSSSTVEPGFIFTSELLAISKLLSSIEL
jgi:hypothetical protein